MCLVLVRKGLSLFTPINIANLNFSNFVPEKRDKQKKPKSIKEQNTILALITLSSFPHIDVDE